LQHLFTDKYSALIITYIGYEHNGLFRLSVFQRWRSSFPIIKISFLHRSWKWYYKTSGY